MGKSRTDPGIPIFLNDIVRGQLIFHSADALYDALKAMAEYKPVFITRVKDRFGTPAMGGWVGLCIDARITTPTLT